MNLENGGYLWLVLVIPCFLYCSFISHRMAGTWLYRFAHRKRRRAPVIVSTLFLSLALGAAIFSLARPAVQYDRVVFKRSGIDVAIGIDVSKSMLAEDELVPEDGRKLFAIPNRLNRARYCALNIITALRGERAGVFMFARKGVPIIPLTTDYGYCQYILKHFNDATIAIPGSDLAQAVATGVSLFEGTSRRTFKTVIIISDGEDISDDKSPVYEAAQRAAAQGIAIYTIGAGMARSSLIPLRDAGGANIVDYYQDADGAYLKTRLEQETLQGIASMTGGSYFHARDENIESSLVDAIVKRASTFEYTKVIEPAWFDLSPALLCAALAFLLLGMLAGR
jgi:Ca-activated chloride channel family protein